MCSPQQISAGVDACLALMGGEFCLQALQANDPNYSWQFKAVGTLAEEHGVTGLYVREGVLVDVFFQAGMSAAETALTIGHELGHHFLHRNNQILECQARDAGVFEFVAGRKILTDERLEWEAERFAELLLARCGIRTRTQSKEG